MVKKTAKKATAKRKKKPTATKTKKAVRKPAAKTKKVAKKKTAKPARAKKTTAKATKAKSVVKLATQPIAKKQTKAQIVAELAEMTSLSKAEINHLFAGLRNLAERHMKPRGSGQFTIPELGLKIRRVQKKATKARMGRNPFTGEEIKIPAKPARKAVRATVLKSLKDIA